MSEIIKNAKSSLHDKDLNLAFNRERWGQYTFWEGKDRYGTRWGGGYQQQNGEVAAMADKFLRPHLGDRYNLRILELSPGAGRFSAEMIRYAAVYCFLDMNEACLRICKERFKYFPIEQYFYLNDGTDCSMVEQTDFDLVACFDSMVHMHPVIAKGYIQKLSKTLKPNGLMFLDHPGKGARSSGHRTNIFASDILTWAKEFDLQPVSQEPRNSTGDYISLLRK